MNRDGEVEAFTIGDCRYKVATNPNDKKQDDTEHEEESEPEEE